MAPASASPTPTPQSLGAAETQRPYKTPPAGRYVVVMKDLPEAAYNGQVPGFAATRPQPGQQFKVDADALNYRGYLQSRQDLALSRVGAGPAAKIYSYTTTVSGFTANLSGRQVLELRKMPNVVSVQRDRAVKLDTVDSPKFLGLSGRNGVWRQTGGPANAGEGIVVGIVDTGIWPGNPSFAGADRVPDVPGFEGYCSPNTERWSRDTCNSKIISARFFVDGIGRENVSEDDYISPRDGNGHGSHTAGTAAGNHGVDVRIEGVDLGTASGMAPAAKIAVYKACWEATDPNATGCYTSDTTSAIDKAVQDGVDVINYSISGSRDDFYDAVERSFLGAASAGVFVATSAGNSGPGRSTVAHPSPWVATVAASTHHLFPGKVVLGNGEEYVGAMISDQAVSKRRIILSSDAAQEGAKPEEAALCYPNTLDPAKVQNFIVVCDRGVIARTDKSAEVERAGGAGMVLVNTTAGSLDADFHSVPTVHLNDEDGAKVKEYVRDKGADARARLDPDAPPYEPVPTIAGFSSRGPLQAGDGDILKPDISAPGVSVVAAVAPPFNNGHRWDLYSGTSMSSPHIAGLGAFIKNLRPSWTPAMVKSAMMTTAYDLKRAHNPFIQGAGHVNPRRFLDPGLVYNAGPITWLNFLNGDRRASNVNQASIAIGELAGRERVARMVTNVSDETETYTAVVRGMEGVQVDVEPATLTIAPTKVRKFEVEFRSTETTVFKKYSTGHLVWIGDQGHRVRTPLVVKPVAVSVPDEVGSTQGSEASTDGYQVIRGRAGFTGELDLTAVGLEGATPKVGQVNEGGDNLTYVETIQVPANTTVARFDMNSVDNEDDLDLYVFGPNGAVYVSAEPAADEQITLVRPPAGDYDVTVYGFDDAQGEGPIDYVHTGWAVPRGNQGNFRVTRDPQEVVAGEAFRYRAVWDNLSTEQRYFGFVKYEANGRNTGQRTYVTVN